MKRLLLPCLALLPLSSLAGHIVGGEILWDCLGNNQYQVTLNLYRDCDGITLDQMQFVSYTSPCDTSDVGLNLVSIAEVSGLCPGQVPNSTCNGGNLPGAEMWTYTGVVTLPSCDQWTLSWESCCRSSTIVNIGDPDLGDLYTKATLNNADHPCDDGPTFAGDAISYLCLNQVATYSFAAVDPESDSLDYAFISAMAAGGAPLQYAPGYSYDQPIPGVVLDPLTGLATFTATMTGSFVLVAQVTAYDDQGNVKGTVMRDIHVVVIPCSNSLPDPNGGAITNLTGTAVQTGPTALVICASGQFCFDFSFSDPDATDALALTTNVTSVLPGSTVSFTGTNPLSGTVCWTAPGSASGIYYFVMSVQDDACPVFGGSTRVYTVETGARADAGADVVICGAQTAALQVTGGTVFTWSVLSGDPMQVGVNFSCNPCNNPVADPSITTTYVVESDLLGGCFSSDTVAVAVVPDFSTTVTVSDPQVCIGEQVLFNVSVNPGAPGYTYAWSPPTGLSAVDVQTPTGTWLAGGTMVHHVAVTSPDGCTRLDSASVQVAPAFPPSFLATQDAALVPCGGSTQFHVTVPTAGAPCTADPEPCYATNSIDAGSDADLGTNTDYPAPFGHFFEGARHQMLYTASELQALGFSGGRLNGIGFEVSAVSGTSVYHEWGIKVGCTTLTELDTVDWTTGLTEVYYADTIQIAAGWKLFPFPQPFTWDGTSNLIVEVCFSNDQHLPGYTFNSPTYYSVTPFASVRWLNVDAEPLVCSIGSAFLNTSNNRPNTRMAFCPVVDPTNMVYAWSPGTGLSDPGSAEPIVTPPVSPSTYMLTVTDTSTNCVSDTTLTVAFQSGEYAAFTASALGGTAPLFVTFTNTSTSGIIAWEWFVDGTSFATTSNSDYTFTQNGTYTVSLNGTDADGCIYTSSVVITIGTVGVMETETARLRVYPDPASDELNVELDASVTVRAVRLMDQLGQVMAVPVTSARNGSLQRLDVSAVPAGTYVLAVATARGNKTALVVVAR